MPAAVSDSAHPAGADAPSPKHTAADIRPRMQRLPGRGSWIFLPLIAPRYQLWLAEDQLLVIKRQGFKQETIRFLLADIRTLDLHSTVRRLVWNIVLGVFCAPIVVAAIADRQSPDVRNWLVIVAVLIVPLLVNILRGPTCVASLSTALGRQRLYALRRLRPARKAFAQIAARSEAVQGALTTEQLAAAFEGSPPASP